jgi:hypothetical protein
MVGLLDGDELRGGVGARDLDEDRVLLLDAFRCGVRHHSLPVGGVKHPVVHCSLQERISQAH